MTNVKKDLSQDHEDHELRYEWVGGDQNQHLLRPLLAMFERHVLHPPMRGAEPSTG